MKKICYVTLAILLLWVTCGFTMSGEAVSWGLKHNSREATPEASPSGITMLRKYGGMFVCDKDAETGSKNVYFTFDLGYEAGFTAECLDILKANNIKATFFLCGNYLQEEELIGRMIAEGHTIGNHTDKHKDLPKLGNDAMRKDITDFADKFEAKYGEAYGRKLTHFRPPQGRFDEHTLKEVAAQGMKTIMWSSAIVDWGKTPIAAKPNADKITNRIHPGAIILFHISNSGTPEMLKLLIPQLQEKGYKIADTGTL